MLAVGYNTYLIEMEHAKYLEEHPPEMKKYSYMRWRAKVHALSRSWQSVCAEVLLGRRREDALPQRQVQSLGLPVHVLENKQWPPLSGRCATSRMFDSPLGNPKTCSGSSGGSPSTAAVCPVCCCHLPPNAVSSCFVLAEKGLCPLGCIHFRPRVWPGRLQVQHCVCHGASV